MKEESFLCQTLRLAAASGQLGPRTCTTASSAPLWILSHCSGRAAGAIKLVIRPHNLGCVSARAPCHGLVAARSPSVSVRRHGVGPILAAPFAQRVLGGAIPTCAWVAPASAMSTSCFSQRHGAIESCSRLQSCACSADDTHWSRCMVTMSCLPTSSVSVHTRRQADLCKCRRATRPSTKLLRAESSALPNGE